jgi:NADH dehydrogenase FAD-containing subunit
MGASLAVATVLSTSMLAQEPVAPQTPAQPRAQQDMTANVVEGQLQSVDATAKTIVVKTAAGKEEKLSYDDTTKVTGGQSGIAGLANSKGTDVTVKFRGTGADRVATEITIKEKKS